MRSFVLVLSEAVLVIVIETERFSVGRRGGHEYRADQEYEYEYEQEHEHEQKGIAASRDSAVDTPTNEMSVW